MHGHEKTRLSGTFSKTSGVSLSGSTVMKAHSKLPSSFKISAVKGNNKCTGKTLISSTIQNEINHNQLASCMFSYTLIPLQLIPIYYFNPAIITYLVV